jgi:hypothetical protein
LGERRQAHTYPGLDCRKVVWRRSSRSRRWASACFVRGGRSARRKSRGSEILRSVGCSYREVGCRSRREASSAQRRGEPRGEPRGGAVARRGSSVPDEGSFIAPGERVRGRVKRTSKGARPTLHPTARWDISVDGRRPDLRIAVAPNPTAAYEGLVRVGKLRVLTQVRGGRRRTREVDLSRKHHLRDRGCQRSRRTVGLLQPKGARGQQPNWQRRAERKPSASHAAPDDKSRPKLPRRKTVASKHGIGGANRATRSCESDDGR